MVSAPYPWLSIYDSKGSLVSNRAIAVIVAPMSLLAGQNRSVPLPPAAQYLDNVTLGGVLYNNATSAPAKFINGTVYDPLNPSALKVNDKVSYITIDEVMPRIELRVARELKQCLDEYALASNGKYPWPEPTDGGAFDITSSQRWFGRVSATPNIETGAGSDAQMQSAWTPSCTTLFTSAYWLEWRNLIFYQIADNFIPSGSKSCILGSCISISGTGNSSAGSGTYRAVVMVAGKTLPPQTRVATISASNYLEDDALSGINNNHQAVFSKSFVTYKPFSAAYNTVNDLIICLDGKNACK